MVSTTVAKSGGDPELVGQVADRRGRVQRGGLRAHHLLGGPAEEGLGAGVEQRDPTPRVGADDGDAPRAVDDAAHEVALRRRVARGADVLAHAQDERYDDHRTAGAEGGQHDPARVGRQVVAHRHVREGTAAEAGEQDRDVERADELRHRLERGDPQRAPRQDRDDQEGR
jgi:hypothetical protein